MQMQDKLIKSSIFEAVRRLHESLDASEVIARAIEALPSLVEADSVAIFLRSEQDERLELARAVNATLAPVGPFIDLGDAEVAVARSVDERRVIAAGDLPGNNLALLCAPLIVGSRVIGAVQLARRSSEAEAERSGFSVDESKSLELFCGSLAQAVANAVDYHNATRQTLIDDLTRLYNVRYLYQTLDGEIRRARRYGSSVSIVFMDLDGFKLVNDAYGHRAGSVTLTEVAQVIAMSVRESDFVARYGGDEFVLMLPETSARRAVQMAERVRDRIARHRFTGGVGADIYLTASFGVSSFPEHATEAEKLIELADAAMYEAKQHSKNNVRIAAS
jgi:diguanylate cyclase (GGDEF)-like protein